ncbi:MAG: hypothetical protein HYX75_05975 [Acidobacteria bacterium]|nr:hypothetical protein [Acidobacteriota bacterium]
MIAFEVSVNGRMVCTAGVRDFGVLSAILTWARRRAEKSGDGLDIEEELTFDVGGLDSCAPLAGEHLKWLGRSLVVGDSVSIRVVEVEQVDSPETRRREDPTEVMVAKRRYLERLKRELGEGTG